VIARAAAAALAIVAGSLVAPPAAAEPPPPLTAPPPAESAAPLAPAPPVDAPPVDAPPVYAPPAYPQPGYAPPGYGPPSYVPPGYGPPIYVPPGVAPPPYVPQGMFAPRPLIWRDGGWYEVVVPSGPPPRPPRDPLFATGIVLGATGLLTTAIGVGVLVSASGNMETCGLSGCIDLPDRQVRSAGAATLAAGISATIFGGAVAIRSGRGPAPARRSNFRTVTGVIFSALGASVASGAVAQAALYRGHDSLPGETFPDGYTSSAAHGAAAPTALAITSLVCFAVGIPLWLTGAKEPAPREDARATASSLDLLPSAGGLALRWTR
jgi:hypothetical protein